MVCCGKSRAKVKDDAPNPNFAVPLAINGCGCGDLKAKDLLGPFLHYRGYNAAENKWQGTCMIVVRDTNQYTLHYVQKPLVKGDTGDKTVESAMESVQGVELDTYKDWRFIRFDLALSPDAEKENLIEYWIECPQKPAGFEFFFERHAFALAAVNQPWHWGFYSCNGFDITTPAEIQAKDWGGPGVLWKDAIRMHRRKPYHLMVGGGDQLYNDDVWALPRLQAWRSIKDTVKKLRTPLDGAAMEDVAAYYFHHYGVHWSTPWMSVVHASIPSANTWDDHDIFDGYGSYDHALQTCPAFTEVFKVAKKFFYLFQHHSTPDRAAEDGMILGHHQLLQVGQQVAVMIPDQRTFRTVFEIVPADGYIALFAEAFKLPETVKHLVFVATVPVIYPHVSFAEGLSKFAKKVYDTPLIGSMMRCMGLGKKVANVFNEPDLLDDLRDHWSSPTHQDERRFLLEHLQHLARSKGIRCSLISGDVHLAAAGYAYSHPHVPVHHDFRYMDQITSSGVGNKPAPAGALSLQQCFAGVGTVTKRTRVTTQPLFRKDHSRRTKLMNRRNYCDIQLNRADDGLTFTIRVEEFREKWRGPYTDKALEARAADPKLGGKNIRPKKGCAALQDESDSDNDDEMGAIVNQATIKDIRDPLVAKYCVKAPKLDGKGIQGRARTAYVLFGAYNC